ncbi:acetate/propionate family kinase [Pelagimonas varians]|uniref:Acetate kinase n=1 Tax=Pelagimonas varians TaxID=696760 RepID=A0A238K1E0_9RHOB|nr:acetate/propionate family kinase [Pelagimonas varians]PYG33266.1 acetate kinase [Pelagimonas varians]SMX36174.1 Acetate kinase [Pelagimonas varians]
MSHVLTLNAGSSTLKFGLFTAAQDPNPLCTGLIDHIGGAATLSLKDSQDKTLSRGDLAQGSAENHDGALQVALAEIGTQFPEAIITAVGHRVVHGGVDFCDPINVTGKVLEDLDKLVALAPLHQPHNLAGIRSSISAFPQAKQIACFDTAFHRQHPFVNDTYALPREYYDKGVRRYGFHGLSYDYISGKLAEIAPVLHAGRVVVAHLGNGASMCALVKGQSIASTMGFSSLDGIAMGTRTGQLDPGVMLYLMDHEAMTHDEISDLLYKQSGLLGMSGVSNDMRELLASENPQAYEAIDYFCCRIQRELGSLAAAIGGLDALVFTGGIGENAAKIRERVCAGMEWIGIEFDNARNTAGVEVVSTSASRVQVMVVPTNEELVIARAASAAVAG